MDQRNFAFMLIIRAAAGVADIMPWNGAGLRGKPYRCVPVWRGFAVLQAVRGFAYASANWGYTIAGYRHDFGFHRVGITSS
jgi:hypothetical protein